MNILMEVEQHKDTLKKVKEYIHIYQDIINNLVEQYNREPDKELGVDFIYQSFKKYIENADDYWFHSLQAKVEHISTSARLLLAIGTTFVNCPEELKEITELLHDFNNFFKYVDKTEQITASNLKNLINFDVKQHFKDTRIDNFFYLNPLLTHFDFINEMAQQCCFETENTNEDIKNFVHSYMVAELGKFVEENGTEIPDDSIFHGYFSDCLNVRVFYRQELAKACQGKYEDKEYNEECDENDIEDFFDETRRWDRAIWDILEEKYGIVYNDVDEKTFKDIGQKIDDFLNSEKGNLPQDEFNDEMYDFCEKIANEAKKQSSSTKTHNKKM